MRGAKKPNDSRKRSVTLRQHLEMHPNAAGRMCKIGAILGPRAENKPSGVINIWSLALGNSGM